MTLSLGQHRLDIRPVDHWGYRWMFEHLLDERPSFRFFKAKLDGELVYVFTRHQTYLAKRWVCLFIMGKGWETPWVINDKNLFENCLSQLERMHLPTRQNGLGSPLIR